MRIPMLARVGWTILPIVLIAGAERVSAKADEPVAEVQTCIERNIPKTASEQRVEFTAVDRLGGERVSQAKIIGKLFDDGLRRVLLRFTKPLDMRGSSLLMVETVSRSNDMFVYSPELRKVRRVTAEGVSGALFGTDFSHEDFELWQQPNQPGSQERLPDARIGEREVYVLATRPDADSDSTYERIVSYVDRETCVVLKMECYEAGDRLRKVLTASPGTIIEAGGIHVASELTMQDLRDETLTNVVVDDLAVDREIDDKEFTVSSLPQHR